MTLITTVIGRLRLPALAAVLLAAVATLTPATAQIPSERDLIEALQGKGSRGAGSAPAAAPTARSKSLLDSLESKGTRGAGAAPAAAPTARSKSLLDALESRGTRAFSAKERSELASAAAEKPSVDLSVYFDFNSAVVTEQARPILMTLGRALSSDELRSGSFMIAGHTDAKGKAAYNKALSERRAMAVREFLIKEFRLEPNRLVSVGYGRERLKNTKQPFAAENRRVQVVNLAQ